MHHPADSKYKVLGKLRTPQSCATDDPYTVAGTNWTNNN